MFLAESVADPDFKVAIKTVQKSKLSDNQLQFKNEIQVMASLDHPNIVKYYETYESPNYLYLVLEHCQGGMLYDWLTKRKQEVTEQKAARVMKQLLLAVNHLHSQGVVHRDLKPENIMFGTDDSVKIIDFGLSKCLASASSQKLSTVAGTPYFQAPEVQNGSYGRECDCWSLGVIMYLLLSGYLPFNGSMKVDVFQQVRKGAFTFNHAEFDSVHPSAKELISGLLKVDRKKRLNCAQALRHPWFVQMLGGIDVNAPRAVNKSTLLALRDYRAVGRSQIRMDALNLLVKVLADSEVGHLRQTFQDMDRDCTGMVTIDELQSAFASNHELSVLSGNDLLKIMKHVDQNGNGAINYSEFLAATISLDTVLTEEKLRVLFKHFDVDNKEYITAENVQEVSEANGRKLPLK